MVHIPAVPAEEINTRRKYKKTTMKKTLLTAALLFVATSANAKTSPVSFPPNAIGVTEAVYEQLKNGNCYYLDLGEESTGNTRTGAFCDEIVARFETFVIFRAEDKGQMYWVNTQDGLPILNRYMPNGFYSVKENGTTSYYWMKDGLRRKVNMNKNVYKQIRRHKAATPQHMAFSMEQGMYDFLTSDTVEAQLSRDSLKGQMFTVDGVNNALYYVTSTGVEKVAKADVKRFIRQNSTRISKNLLQQIVSAKHMQ